MIKDQHRYATACNDVLVIRNAKSIDAVLRHEISMLRRDEDRHARAVMRDLRDKLNALVGSAVPTYVDHHEGFCANCGHPYHRLSYPHRAVEDQCATCCPYDVPLYPNPFFGPRAGERGDRR